METPRGLVLLRRAHEPAKGLLDFPGGFVDYGEGLEQAAIREVHEELGVTVSGLTYVASFPNLYLYKGMTYHTTDPFFRCRDETPELLRHNDEAVEIVFLPIDTVPEAELGFDSGRNVLRLVRGEGGG